MSHPSVLFLAERYEPDLGGLARSSTRTAQSLQRAGADVHVLAWTRTLGPGQLTSTQISEHHWIHRLGLFHKMDSSLQHTHNVAEWLHREHPFHLVWGHYLFPAGFMAVWLARMFGLPSVVSARGNDVDIATFPPGDFARLSWTLERASTVTAVSRDLAKKIWAICDRDDVIVTPNVVDLDLFHPGPAEPELRGHLGIRSDEAVIGFSGELRHKKGLPFLLDALHTVRQTKPACLLVIGEVRAREQDQLARFGVVHPEDRARIIVTGHLDQPSQVARHLRLADVLVSPSLWDGMPNAVLEAMAIGKVVIGSDAGGIPEIITHGDNGLLVPRSELHRLGEALVEWLDQPSETRIRIELAARETVQRHHHPSAEIRMLKTLLTRESAIEADVSISIGE